jgi:hypothetical protein
LARFWRRAAEDHVRRPLCVVPISPLSQGWSMVTRSRFASTTRPNSRGMVNWSDMRSDSELYGRLSLSGVAPG